ncbi:MAG: hypothetical protein HYV16_04990 [Gammaproteobacteria bacterium]|nr:hypothetical protein [Gammaproteobacteria bacterium]
MPWFANVAVAGIVMWAVVEVVKMVLTHRKERDAGAQLGAEKDAQLAALEERVRILEAIVTDKSYDLKQKINSL